MYSFQHFVQVYITYVLSLWRARRTSPHYGWRDW